MIHLVTIALQCAKIHLSKAPAFFFFELYSIMAFLRKVEDHGFLIFSLNVKSFGTGDYRCVSGHNRSALLLPLEKKQEQSKRQYLRCCHQPPLRISYSDE